MSERDFVAVKDRVMDRAKMEAPRQLAQLAELQSIYPHREITLIEHHGPSDRVLALVQNVAEAGCFVVYDATARKAWEFVQRAPGLTGGRSHAAAPFDLTNAAGERFTGTLVLPRSPRVKRAPLVLWMPEQLGGRVRGYYHPEVQALADMGFAVAAIDGLQSLDLPEREDRRIVDRAPLPEFNTFVPTARPPRGSKPRVDPTAEIIHQIHSLDTLANNYPVSRAAVALYGQGFTGARGLAAAAAMPGRFHCVVALDPAIVRFDDLKSGRFGALDDALDQVAGVPFEFALILGFPGPAGKLHGPRPEYQAARGAIAALAKTGVLVESGLLDEAYMARQAAARAAVFRRIEAFLTEHLYHYSVKLGEMQEIAAEPPVAPR